MSALGEAKPWQIGLIVVGLLTFVGMIVWQCSRKDVELANTITLVDVETGQLIQSRLPERRAITLPAKNPQTNRKSLIPAYQDEAGVWKADQRMLGSLPQDVKTDGLSDPREGTIKVAGDAKPVSKDVW